jgi:hypothetical protein
MHLAACFQVLPPLVGVLSGRWTIPARRWVLVACLGLALADAVAWQVALHGGENQFVTYVFLPLTGAALLWAFSDWQTTETTRLAMRLAIVPFIAVSVVLSLWVDDPRRPSLYTAPFHSVAMLIAASWTFVRRSLAGTGPLMRQDWFWITAGFMVYFGAYTAIQPLTAFLIAAGRNDLILAAFNVRAVVVILAWIAVSGGMLCPIPLTPSGGPSSRRFWAWPFWWARSGSPW